MFRYQIANSCTKNIYSILHSHILLIRGFHMRIRSLIIASAIGLGLAGCGGAQTTSPPPRGFPAAQAATPAPATARPTTALTSTPAAAPTAALPTASAAESAAIDTTSLTVPAEATDLKVEDGHFGKEVTYLIDWDLDAVIAFYNQELAPFGVQITCGLSNPEANFYSCSQSTNGLGVFINLERKSATQTHVNIELADLNSPAPTSEPTGSSGGAEIKDGLPVPADASNTIDQSGPFRRSLSTSSEQDVASLVAFYRAELPALGWTEQADQASVAAGATTLTFGNDEGPLVVELSEAGGGTDIVLTTRALAAATAAGILGKPGQARVMLGNMSDADATIVIDGQELQVAAGEGADRPDGPALDLAPGTYTVTIIIAGQEDQEEQLEVGADEVWGLILGPGGAMPLQLY
jgi:hypothetical protein